MGGRWSRVSGVAPVGRVEMKGGGHPWAEPAANAPRREPPPAVRVSRATLRALYASSEADAASWPLLHDGGVVAEPGPGR
jgi:hypothetical protein